LAVNRLALSYASLATDRLPPLAEWEQANWAAGAGLREAFRATKFQCVRENLAFVRRFGVSYGQFPFRAGIFKFVRGKSVSCDPAGDSCGLFPLRAGVFRFVQ